MTSHFDAVLTYHSNIHTCGVARFNHYLARHLSVPLLSLLDFTGKGTANAIVSIKFSEIEEQDLKGIATNVANLRRFSLILHDFVASPILESIVGSAESVMGLNNEIVSRLQVYRPDTVLGFTVASYEVPPRMEVPDLTLITFGMAHKIQSARYRKVADLLRDDPRTHLLEISSALHEGTQFNDSFFQVGDEISEFFGGRVRFLGFLADPEVSLRVARADAMLAFFPGGARENNNSVVSSMHLAVPVVTNLDERSPGWLRHNETVFDIEKLNSFPSKSELERVGEAGRRATLHLTYTSLLQNLSRKPDAD